MGPSTRGTLPEVADEPITLAGIAGAPGVGVGEAIVLEPRTVSYVRRSVGADEVAEEERRFFGAVRLVQHELSCIVDKDRVEPSVEWSILEAYVLMVGDETLSRAVCDNIRQQQQCVEWAVSTAIETLSAALAAQEDPYLRERSHDFEFVGERLLRALTGAAGRRTLPETTEPCVLLARDVSPADLVAVGRDRIFAIATEVGTRTSHTAILARAMQIPCVLGVEGLLEHAVSGQRVVVDGLRGTVTLRASHEDVERGALRGERQKLLATSLRVDLSRPAALASGETVSIYANLELSGDAESAAASGADGVGLYRTEFLFAERHDLPSEDEQAEHYTKVVKQFRGRPVTMRTFDVGADKNVPSFGLPPERNPALGFRAVRIALARRDVFGAQLRAMLRSSAHGDVRVMVPMVATLRELHHVHEAFREAIAAVDAAGHPRASQVPLGVMIEVPAVAILADLFAPHAAFFSIGTNDLIQYTLAVDRTSPQLAALASPFDPSVLRLVRRVIQVANETQKPLSVCGAMASDPLAALLLVGLGIRALSMEPAAIPEIKAALLRVTRAEVEQVARQALELPSAQDVEHLLAVTFAPRVFDLLSGDAENAPRATA
jgi:phosphoenolpyruvate-protein phosphotransferase (PTS system enzyme I)